MKLLILMMSCNNYHFIKQAQISKKSLHRQIKHHKLENNIMVYDYVGDVESNYIKDSTIYLNSNDDADYTFEKTINCLKFIQTQMNKYDYIFRTNTSTFINVKLLYEFIKLVQPNDTLWTSEIYSTYDIKCPNLYDIYPRGNGLILSKKIINILIENTDNAKNTSLANSMFEHSAKISDDACIGTILNMYFKDEVLNHIKSFTHGWYKTYDTRIKNKGNKLCNWDNTIIDEKFIQGFITIQLKNYMNPNDLQEKNFDELTNIVLNINFNESILIFIISYSINPSIYIGYLSKKLYVDYNKWILFYYKDKLMNKL